MKYDQTRRCPKCAGSARTDYLFKKIQRICNRCGYVWHEEPLDFMQDEAEEAGK